LPANEVVGALIDECCDGRLYQGYVYQASHAIRAPIP
jgi:hypothetical protein